MTTTPIAKTLCAKLEAWGCLAAHNVHIPGPFHRRGYGWGGIPVSY